MANKKPFTKEQYDQMVTHFRAHPGDIHGAARVVGCDWRTAARAWRGPPRRNAPEDVRRPIQEVFAAEEAARLQAQAEIDAQARAKIVEEAEQAKAHAIQAKQWDENILRLARNDVMKGLGTLANMTTGLDALAKRVNEQLVRGTDSKGNPIDVPLGETLRVLVRFSQATRALTEAANALVAIERIKANMPTAIIALEHQGPISLEDAAREVELVGTALQRARHLGLTVLAGGASKEVSGGG